MSNLKETKINSKVVYEGDFLDVRKDNVLLPNGEKGNREWINHPGASVIIPVFPDGKIALIRQFRYAVGSEFIELPAGKLDLGENPLECAKRELEEEIGYKSNNIEFIANIHPAIGFANEKAAPKGAALNIVTTERLSQPEQQQSKQPRSVERSGQQKKKNQLFLP